MTPERVMLDASTGTCLDSHSKCNLDHVGGLSIALCQQQLCKKGDHGGSIWYHFTSFTCFVVCLFAL